MLKPRKKFIEVLQFSRVWIVCKRIIFFIIAVSLAAFIIYMLFFSKVFKISEIVYSARNEKPYITIDLSPIFHETVGRNFFFIRERPLEEQVLNNHPLEIKSVEITIKIPSKLVVKYEIFTPTANLIVRKDNLERKFVLNEKGIIAASDAEDDSLPYIAGSFEDFPKKQVRMAIVDPDALAKMSQAYTLFTEKFGMKVNKILYLKTSREAHLKTEKKFLVMLDLTQEIDHQLFKLKQALPKLDIYNTPLEYIDLRISGKNGNKIIFKRK